jgi:ribosomal protein S27AE
MVKRPGLSFKAHACPRCGGDAYLEAAADDPEWRCLQCGRTVPQFGALVAPVLAPARIPARTRWS